MMDWTVGDLVTKKIETTWWRLQFWKGKYGATYVPKIQMDARSVCTTEPKRVILIGIVHMIGIEE